MLGTASLRTTSAPPGIRADALTRRHAIAYSCPDGGRCWGITGEECENCTRDAVRTVSSLSGLYFLYRVVKEIVSLLFADLFPLWSGSPFRTYCAVTNPRETDGCPVRTLCPMERYGMALALFLIMRSGDAML